MKWQTFDSKIVRIEPDNPIRTPYDIYSLHILTF